ncbi:MAG: DMT family transporter [Planktomarina sp.]
MNTRAILAGLAFAFIWSSAFTSARIIVTEAPPMLSLALRFFISGVLGVLIAKAMGQTWNLTRAQWRAVVIFGICQNALYLGLNFIAMQTVEASLASIIASTMPLLVGLIGWLVLSDRPSGLGLIGLILGTMGVLLIMGSRLQGGADVFGIALCLIGVVSLAIATLTVRSASGGGNLMMIVGLQMLVGAFGLLIPGLIFENWEVTWSPTLVTAFAYTTIFPGLIATLIWFWLVQEIGAIKAATFHLLNPFFGAAIAAALLGEALGWRDVMGVIIITVGIYAVQRSRVSAR